MRVCSKYNHMTSTIIGHLNNNSCLFCGGVSVHQCKTCKLILCKDHFKEHADNSFFKTIHSCIDNPDKNIPVHSGFFGFDIQTMANAMPMIHSFLGGLF